MPDKTGISGVRWYTVKRRKLNDARAILEAQTGHGDWTLHSSGPTTLSPNGETKQPLGGEKEKTLQGKIKLPNLGDWIEQERNEIHRNLITRLLHQQEATFALREWMYVFDPHSGIPSSRMAR